MLTLRPNLRKPKLTVYEVQEHQAYTFASLGNCVKVVEGMAPVAAKAKRELRQTQVMKSIAVQDYHHISC